MIPVVLAIAGIGIALGAVSLLAYFDRPRQRPAAAAAVIVPRPPVLPELPDTAPYEASGAVTIGRENGEPQ